MATEERIYYLNNIDNVSRRLKNQNTFGKYVREQLLNPKFVDAFMENYTTLHHSTIALSELTTGDSNTYVNELLDLLKRTKTKITNLQATSKEEIETVQDFLDRAEALRLDRRLARSEELIAKIDGDLQKLEEQLSKKTDDFLKNADLERAVFAMCARILEDDLLYLIEKTLTVKDYVQYPHLQAFPKEVMDVIAPKFSATREFSVYENEGGKGERLLSFKDGVKTEHKVHTYLADENISDCQEARENGVDVVAKRGLALVSHYAFDMGINFLDEFTFYRDPALSTVSLIRKKEEIQYKFMFERQIVRQGGLLLFNLPYFKIHEFRSMLAGITLLGLYRVDDAMKNVLFVADIRKPLKPQTLLLQRAIFKYDGLPHYSEFQEINISDGELTLPKIFKARFVDDQDILTATLDFPDTIDVVTDFYTPIERSIELSQPLQGYKDGHLPSAATSEVINGIYDTSVLSDLGLIDSSVDFPMIYTTKIVQQEVEERIEEDDRTGKPVVYISKKKKNFIVCNAITLDGEVIEYLNSQEDIDETEEEMA